MRYSDDQEAFSTSAAYIGDTTMAQSIWAVAQARRLMVHVKFLPAIHGPHPDRRALAEQLRGGIEQALIDAQATVA
jgi:1-acyl-sn-glycerol-3-phosphate acyltransferase